MALTESTSQFKTKLDFQWNKLYLQLQKEFLNDLKKLRDDECEDINIHIDEEEIDLRHRCVINALCPLFKDMNLTNVVNESICLEKYPDSIEQRVKKLFQHIYLAKSDGTVGETDTGIDLSSLLKDGYLSDVTFKVQDVEFKCHKCVLSCRCVYFSKMLGGNWKEGKLDIIELKDISPETFHLVLTFIYSGQMIIPEGADLNELLYVSDIYIIPGIKLLVTLHMKAYMCHFFATPCDVCITGVIKTLELCQIFCLSELQEECYDWFTKKYAKIFQNRCISKSSEQLKIDIKDKIKESITSSTVIRHLKECNKLKSCLPSVKWGQTIKTLIGEIEEYCSVFVCNKFEEMCAQPSFKFCLFSEKDINASLMMQEIFVNVITNNISKNNCIDIYKCVMKIEQMREREEMSEDSGMNRPNVKEAIENCKKFTGNLEDVCKKFIQKNIYQIQKMKKWKNLDQKIKEELMASSGFISIADEEGQSSIQNN